MTPHGVPDPMSPFVLMSRAFLRGRSAKSLRACTFFLDCGAWTDYTKGRPTVTVDEYLRYIDGLQALPGFAVWQYLALDVVGNHQATMENLREMRRQGYSPIPIFQVGGDLGDLPEMASGAPFVAIGGIVREVGYVRLKQIYETGALDDLRVHWLGQGTFKAVQYYRPWSFDTSNLVSAQMYGNMKLLHPAGKFTTYTVRNVSRMSKRERRNLARIGVRYRDLAKAENWRGNHSLSSWVTFRTYRDYAEMLLHRYGIRYFAALSNVMVANRYLDCMDSLWSGVDNRRQKP